MLRKMNAFPMFEKHLWKVEKSYKKKSQKKKKKNPQNKKFYPQLICSSIIFSRQLVSRETLKQRARSEWWGEERYI